MFKTTEWKYSDVVDPKAIGYTVGPSYLLIEDARIYNHMYIITFKDVQTEGVFEVRYYFEDVDADTGDTTVNATEAGKLISLGTALAGVPIGIPNVVDIKGGVVFANVSERISKNSGNKYPIIYRYEPAPEGWVMAYGKIEQYYTPDEEPSEEE